MKSYLLSFYNSVIFAHRVRLTTKKSNLLNKKHYLWKTRKSHSVTYVGAMLCRNVSKTDYKSHT